MGSVFGMNSISPLCVRLQTQPMNSSMGMFLPIVFFVEGSPKCVDECQNLSDRFSIVNLRLVIRLLYNFTSNYTRMGQLSRVDPFYLDVINNEIKMGVNYE